MHMLSDRTTSTASDLTRRITSQLNETSQTQITLDEATPPSIGITILTIVHEMPNLSHITCLLTESVKMMN